jgi:hypothetical protein
MQSFQSLNLGGSGGRLRIPKSHHVVVVTYRTVDADCRLRPRSLINTDVHRIPAAPWRWFANGVIGELATPAVDNVILALLAPGEFDAPSVITVATAAFFRFPFTARSQVLYRDDELPLGGLYRRMLLHSPMATVTLEEVEFGMAVARASIMVSLTVYGVAAPLSLGYRRNVVLAQACRCHGLLLDPSRGRPGCDIKSTNFAHAISGLLLLQLSTSGVDLTRVLAVSVRDTQLRALALGGSEYEKRVYPSKDRPPAATPGITVSGLIDALGWSRVLSSHFDNKSTIVQQHDRPPISINIADMLRGAFFFTCNVHNVTFEHVAFVQDALLFTERLGLPHFDDLRKFTLAFIDVLLLRSQPSVDLVDGSQLLDRLRTASAMVDMSLMMDTC